MQSPDYSNFFSSPIMKNENFSVSLYLTLITDLLKERWKDL